MKFGEISHQIIVTGGMYAKALGCETYGSECLLLGLCDVPSDISALLEKHKVTKELILDAIQRDLNTDTSKINFEEIALTTIDEVLNRARTDTRKILFQSELVSSRLYNTPIVKPEAILWTMFRFDNFKSYDLLRMYADDIDSLKGDLKRYIQRTAANNPFGRTEGFIENNPLAEISSRREKSTLRRERYFNEQNSKESKTPTLDSFGKNLTKMAANGEIDPVVGREEEINRVMQILARRKKNNPCLVGEPGVGKTAIAEGIALKIAENDVPEIVQGKTIFQIELGGLVAGSKYRGEFEERIKNILDEAASNPNIILFIDEIHTIIGAGGSEGSLDAANIMKPMLTRGEFQLIGATTLDEYSKYIEKDPALERRFQKVTVNEPSEADSILIIKGLREKYEKHHKIKIPDEAIEQAVLLSSRYLSDRFLPDKAIDLIDEAAARKRINFASFSEKTSLKEELEQVLKMKKEAADKMEFERASELHTREKAIIARIEEIDKNKAASENAEYIETLSVDDIADVLAKWSGIPVNKITESDTERLRSLSADLKARVIGQDEAVESIARAIQRSRLGLKDPNRPAGSFIFLGTTGVGKTELAKALAEQMFGNENALVRIDMSEYMEKNDVTKLIGSPPGYVGYEEGGQLTEKVRRQPYSVVLFDEVEKAHPDIFNTMLQILDDGRLTDGKGRVVDFKNTIIIMTSNVGARMLTADNQRRIGFSLSEDDTDMDENSRDRLYGGKTYDDAKKEVIEELKKTFTPEFLNRLDEIIFFRMLGRESILKIVDLLTKSLGKRINDLGIGIKLTDRAKELLAKKGYDPQYGARPLRRVIQQMVEDKFSEALLDGIIAPGDIAIVDVDDELAPTSIRIIRESKSDSLSDSGDGVDGDDSNDSGDGGEQATKLEETT